MLWIITPKHDICETNVCKCVRACARACVCVSTFPDQLQPCFDTTPMEWFSSAVQFGADHLPVRNAVHDVHGPSPANNQSAKQNHKTNITICSNSLEIWTAVTLVQQFPHDRGNISYDLLEGNSCSKYPSRGYIVHSKATPCQEYIWQGSLCTVCVCV